MIWWAAGVLPVSTMDDETPVVLLGRDARWKGGGWSDFAGGGETVDASPEDTALRELEEETSGLVRLERADLLVAARFRDVTPRGKTLHRFVVRVPFDPSLPDRFVENPEKVAIAWFALNKLPYLRRVFETQMRRDAEAIATYAAAARNHHHHHR